MYVTDDDVLPVPTYNGESDLSSSDGPVFILCTARSGSTLLRYILNAHSELACPPETGCVAIIDSVLQTYAAVHRTPDLGAAQLRDAYSIARQTINTLFHEALRREHKRRWCDKSIPNVDHCDLLLEAFPDASFLCLYRQFRDFAVSALEASPFGLAGYGFEAYARDTPGNTLLAIARYWVDKVERALLFETSHPSVTARIRYEDLVDDAEATMTSTCKFLQLPWEPQMITQAAFPHTGLSTLDGHQDHKIVYTDSIRTCSVGRGWSLPIELVPQPLRERINSLHEQLGYPPVEMDCLRIDPADVSPSPDVLLSSLEVVLTDRVTPRLRNLVVTGKSVEFPEVTLVEPLMNSYWRLTSSGVHPIPPTARAEPIVSVDARAVVAIANGYQNAAVALRLGLLRTPTRSDGQDAVNAARRLLDFVISLIVPHSPYSPSRSYV